MAARSRWRECWVPLSFTGPLPANWLALPRGKASRSRRRATISTGENSLLAIDSMQVKAEMISPSISKSLLMKASPGESSIGGENIRLNAPGWLSTRVKGADEPSTNSSESHKRTLKPRGRGKTRSRIETVRAIQRPLEGIDLLVDTITSGNLS